MNRILILDTELTSLKEPEVIEVAWAELDTALDLAGDYTLISLIIGEQYCERFKPVKPSTMASLAIHHILPEELERCRPSCEFRLPKDTGYIIGHSIDVDWFAIGQPDVKRIDTHAMAQWVWPDATGYSVVALIYMLLGQTFATRAIVKEAHSALADVMLEWIILREILNRNPQIQTWEQLWEFSEECRIPRTCPLKRYEGVLLEDLNPGFVEWCLCQDWLDPYFRKGLYRVLDKWHAEEEEDEAEHAWPGDQDDDIPF